MIIARLKAAAVGWSEDQAAQMGAALAYYTLFSLTPLLVLTIAVIGTLLGEQQTRDYVLDQVQSYSGKDSADAVGMMLENFQGTHSRAGASLIGTASLLFGATGMFTSLRTSLLRIWRLPPGKDGVVVGFVKTYLLAFLMVFVSCVFLLALLLASTVSPLLYQRWAERYPALPWSGPAADFALSTLLISLLVAFTFRFLSDGRVPYSRLWFGAAVTALLFALGKMGLGYYFSLVNLGSAYGAAGSVVVFLAWVYYSAQIVFFGAEVVRFGLPAGQAGRASP